MKRITFLTFLLLGLMAVSRAEDKPHVLTDAERAAIYRGLYEQQQAQSHLAQVQAALQKALAVCAPLAVGQDDKGELKCIPEEPKK